MGGIQPRILSGAVMTLHEWELIVLLVVAYLAINIVDAKERDDA